MSDLDADLYSDLYGNDDGDAHDTVDDEKDAQPPAPAKTADPRLAAAPAEQKEASKVTQPSAEANGTAKYSAPVASAHPSASAIPTYTQPQTQQIPTYEQPLTNDYRDLTAGRADGGYQNIPVTERTVRPSEMKDEGKMFIGGLNWDTTDDALREYFTQFGKVDACTIMRDAAGRSRCFAFLTFEDPASVNAVMVREHFLDGKIIDPKRAIPRQEHQRATKLFIGGLAGSVTSESMREFFSQFGKVIDSTVMLDRETGRSKGFGFVSFEDTNVQPFLGFGNLEIDGKLIDVKLAQPRYQRDSYPNEDGPQMQVQGTNRPFGGAAQQGGNFASPAAAVGNTPFDPQALAALYTRMFQMAGGGQLNPAMMGGMNPAMMGGMGAMGMGAGGMGGGMRPGMGMGMGMGGVGMGGGGMTGGMGRGAGGPGMMGGGGAGGGGGGPAQMNPNIPRGPRAAAGGAAQGPPTGPQSVGPQRTAQRGQHNFHPYAR